VHAEHDELLISIADELGQASQATAGQTASRVPEQGEIALAVPGSALGNLPPEILREWNALLHSRLNFIHTAPDILAAASGQELVSLYLGEKGASLGVRGAPNAFLTATNKAIVAEEAYRRPEPRAFRLPDGTIGRELVPGEERETTAPQEGSCAETGIGVVVCRSGNAAAIGSGQDLALNSLKSAPWHILVGENYLKAAGLPVGAISAIGDSEGAIIRLKLAQ
jgi:hypothetical protein